MYQEDIDECMETERPCKDRWATCQNTVGSFKCLCPDGFEMDDKGYCQGEVSAFETLL